MANELENLMNDLMAIPAEEVKKPSMPVSVYIQEASDLAKWAQQDKEKLTFHGLDWSNVESIPQRAIACRDAQSIWAREFKAMEQAEKEWLQKSPEAFKMRDKLLADFRFAFRKEPSLLAKVTIIAEGASREDMIQDLNDISFLGKSNTGLLEAIKFDLTKLDLAAETAIEMSKLLSDARGENGGSQQLEVRDRAYTYLKIAVDEIKAYGKYVFAEKRDRLDGYLSDYIRKSKRKTNGDPNNEEVEK